MQLVPDAPPGKKFPCRYIPLNDRGETIDSFYRSGTEEELEQNLGEWLKSTIQRLEKETPEDKLQAPGQGRASAKGAGDHG
jgi:hypothetical protein